MFDNISRVRCAEGFSCRQKVGSFQPITLPLRVLAVNDIQARGKFNRAGEVAKVVRFNAEQVHNLILT